MQSKPALHQKQLQYHAILFIKVMYSLPVGALNLTVVSKSLPVKVNNAADDLTVSLICPSR